MQKLYVESQLPVNPELAWEIFEGDAFRARLASHTKLTSEVLSESTDGDVQVRTLRFTSATELPKMVAKALGSKSLQYDQTNRLDLAKSRLDWNVVLPNLSDRVSVAGSTIIEPAAGGSRRVVDGTIEVKMRLIGGQIEKVVVGQFEKSMRKAVDVALEMMREHGNS